MIFLTILAFHTFTMPFCNESEWRSTTTALMNMMDWSDMKLHIFAAKHKVNTYREHLIHSDIAMS